MKKTILSLAIAVMLLACSKDSDAEIIITPDTNNTLKYTQLSTKNNVNDTPKVLANFYYSDKKLITIGYQPDEKNNRLEHTYSGDKLISQTRYSEGVAIATIVFEYSGEYISKRTIDNEITHFSYNNLNQLVEAKEYKSDVLNQTTTYTYDSNGNISEKVVVVGDINMTHQYEYDAFKSNSQLMYSLAVRMVMEFSPNNIRKETKIDLEKNLIHAQYHSSYKYNDSGYPIEITSLSGDISILKYE